MTENIKPEYFEDFEYFEVDTEKDGQRFIRFGTYIYCAECSMDDETEKDWREVSERFSLPLDRFIQMMKDGHSPWSTKECEERPLDYIEDLTKAEAIERFNYHLTSFPLLNGKDVTMDTPDGGYFGTM